MLLQMSSPQNFLFTGRLKIVERPGEKKQLHLSRPVHFPFTGGLKNVKKLEKKKSGCSYPGPKIFHLLGAKNCRRNGKKMVVLLLCWG